jgi:uncharacterized protein with HEPN domain
MPETNRDIAALWDMAQAIANINEVVSDTDREQFLANWREQSIIERQLEILGEAARRISEKFQQEHPDMNWRQIIGLRNVIAHQYDRIEPDLIWEIITSDLLGLYQKIQQLLPPLP